MAIESMGVKSGERQIVERVGWALREVNSMVVLMSPHQRDTEQELKAYIGVCLLNLCWLC